MSRTDRLIRYWDKEAPHFDRAISWTEPRFLAPSRRWIAERVTGTDVLEIAIGTGLNLPYYPADVRLTGVEWSPGMIEQTRLRAGHLGRDIELVRADAAALPFPDASFDTVVCTFSLCSIPAEHAALNEAMRVLRPGGRLLLADHIGSTNPLLRVLQYLLDAVTVPLQSEHWTRRPLTVLRAMGVEIVESQRGTQGAIERVHARKG